VRMCVYMCVRMCGYVCICDSGSASAQAVVPYCEGDAKGGRCVCAYVCMCVCVFVWVCVYMRFGQCLSSGRCALL